MNHEEGKGGVPWLLYVLDNNIAQKRGENSEWTDIEPGFPPGEANSVIFNFLANSHGGPIVSEQEAKAIAEGWGTTLPHL